ncbi:MAG: dihydropteroate synthase [Candidatus Melainabacteria bacterium RIFOXYA12_FULL_32_12]|nr:MAG: dihydropteroate synthase [Candidatus Melainabacteria bacterium RIFOXYA2_FULL_32_9]OGI24269.1 MAG: dihydropteroate synthase [Candidatus Melainabacteria bacterium RIFOXYA12_FULL_32_12]
MQNNFYIRKITPQSAESVMEDVGFDKHYIKTALSKYQFELVKIHNLSSPAANIIKQLALSIGADAAVHREVITCKVGKSDVLLGCTQAQLKYLAEKLKYQPFKLKDLSSQLLELLQNEFIPPLKVRDTVFDWSKKTYIMGILNVTPDSFSDGGKFLNIEAAVAQASQMIDSGADIIDIGGESTRPGAVEISPEEELKRVLPVIKAIREINKSVIISIDTRHSEVAKEAVIQGADIVNDVAGFDHDPDMIKVTAELRCPVIIMHSLSDPTTMQINPTYPENVVDSIFKSLYDKTQKALEAGILKENIIIDPGIGFGKTLEHNIEIVQRISEFKSLGYPLLVGVSRKSIIARILELPPEEREEANIAINSYLAANGVNIIRVHDVEKHYKAFKVLDRIIKD